jgi:hypothetical protein
MLSEADLDKAQALAEQAVAREHAKSRRTSARMSVEMDIADLPNLATSAKYAHLGAKHGAKSGMSTAAPSSMTTARDLNPGGASELSVAALEGEHSAWQGSTGDRGSASRMVSRMSTVNKRTSFVDGLGAEEEGDGARDAAAAAGGDPVSTGAAGVTQEPTAAAAVPGLLLHSVTMLKERDPSDDGLPAQPAAAPALASARKAVQAMLHQEAPGAGSAGSVSAGAGANLPPGEARSPRDGDAGKNRRQSIEVSGGCIVTRDGHQGDTVHVGTDGSVSSWLGRLQRLAALLHSALWAKSFHALSPGPSCPAPCPLLPTAHLRPSWSWRAPRWCSSAPKT